MARPVILGNGGLTVGLNEQGLVHDFYYPYVGLDNLTTSRSVHHKIGVWVDGTFSWVNDGTWEISVDFEDDALVSNVTMKHESLRLEITAQDFVDSQYNAFCRQLTLKNVADDSREIRVFMHQVFQISRAGRADTALYVPDEHYLLDYKGNCSLLIYGQDEHGAVYDQFAVGNYGIEGKEGTFRDAEDGELSGSLVEHGGVDSVIRFKAQLPANGQNVFHYWIVASDSQYAAEEIHQVLKQEGLQSRLAATRAYWQDWLAISEHKMAGTSEQYRTMVKKSLLIIKAHTDKRGGVIASVDSSIYNYGRDYYSYVWPRDGAYALWPLIRMGYTDEAKAFFRFCRDIQTKDGYLMHKFQPDQAIGSTWHPLLHQGRRELAIQEDETAVIVYMLGEYFQYSGDEVFVGELFDTFVRSAAHFMAGFIDDQTGLPHASYDLWEQKFLTSSYTSALVYQALLVAAELARKFGTQQEAEDWQQAAERISQSAGLFLLPNTDIIRNGFLLQPDGSLQFDDTLDTSSLYGAVMYDLFQDDHLPIVETAKQIEQKLLNQSPSGGNPRYLDDHYFEIHPQYAGNPWIVTTMWMAQYYIRIRDPEAAHRLLQWAMEHALPSGVLSEQVDPVAGTLVSVTPLVWSHAEFINTVLDVSKS